MINIYNDGVLFTRTLAEVDKAVPNDENGDFMLDAIEEIKVKLCNDLKDLDNIDWNQENHQ